MTKYPKFEKVDDHTIRIIMEKANEVSLAKIIQNREQLLQQKKMVEEALKNVEKVLENAKKLGITPKEVTSNDSRDNKNSKKTE